MMLRYIGSGKAILVGLKQRVLGILGWRVKWDRGGGSSVGDKECRNGDFLGRNERSDFFFIKKKDLDFGKVQ